MVCPSLGQSGGRSVGLLVHRSVTHKLELGFPGGIWTNSIRNMKIIKYEIKETIQRQAIDQISRTHLSLLLIIVFVRLYFLTLYENRKEIWIYIEMINIWKGWKREKTKSIVCLRKYERWKSKWKKNYAVWISLLSSWAVFLTFTALFFFFIRL